MSKKIYDFQKIVDKILAHKKLTKKEFFVFYSINYVALIHTAKLFLKWNLNNKNNV